MPRQAKVDKNKRTQWDARDTNRWTTPNVRENARPVDAYVRPQQAFDVPLDKTWANFLGTAQESIGTLAGATGVLQNRRDKDDTEQAERDVALGNVAPDDATEAYYRSYFRTKGQNAAIDYLKELDGFVTNNALADDKTFNKGMLELKKKYTQGQNGDYLTVFGDASARGELYAVNARNDAQHKATIEAHMMNQGKKFLNQLELGATPEDLRATMTIMQKENMLVGVHRSQTTAALSQAIINRAKELEDDTVLKVLDMPDESGYRPVMDPAIKAAVMEADRVITDRQRKRERDAYADEQLKSSKLTDDAFQLAAAIDTGDATIDQLEDYIKRNRDQMVKEDLSASQNILRAYKSGERGKFDAATLADYETRINNGSVDDNPTVDEIWKAAGDGRLTIPQAKSLTAELDETKPGGRRSYLSGNAFKMGLEQVAVTLQPGMTDGMGGKTYDWQQFAIVSARHRLDKMIENKEKVTDADVLQIFGEEITKTAKMSAGEGSKATTFEEKRDNLYQAIEDTKGTLDWKDRLFKLQTLAGDYTKTLPEFEAELQAEMQKEMAAQAEATAPPTASEAGPKKEWTPITPTDVWNGIASMVPELQKDGPYLSIAEQDPKHFNAVMDALGRQWLKRGWDITFNNMYPGDLSPENQPHIDWKAGWDATFGNAPWDKK